MRINLLNPGTLLTDSPPELEFLPDDEVPDKYYFCTECGDKVKYGKVHECWVWLKKHTQETLPAG